MRASSLSHEFECASVSNILDANFKYFDTSCRRCTKNGFVVAVRSVKRVLVFISELMGAEKMHETCIEMAIIT